MPLKYNLNSKSFVPCEYGVIVKPQIKEHDIWDENLNPNVENEIKNFLKTNVGNIEIKNYSENPEKFVILNDLGNCDEYRTVYHFFQIKCNKYTEAVFLMRVFKRLRIWVNSQLFCITNPRGQMFFVELKKGLNTIIIETPWAKPHDSFFLRVSAHEVEKKWDKFERLLSDCLIPLDSGFIYPASYYLFNGEPFVFNFFSNDTVNVDINQNVELDLFYANKTYEKNLLVKKTVKMGKKCVLETKDYYYPDPEKLNALRLKLSYRRKNGSECIIRKDVYISNFDNVERNIKRKTLCKFKSRCIG